MKRRRRRACLALLAVAALAGCGTDSDEQADQAGEATTAGAADGSVAEELAPAATDTAPAAQRYPDVVDATATSDGTTWTFSATVSSPYDSPERYADAWRVIAPDGTVIGVRELTHHHAGEQPFTRSLAGVEVPDGVTVVTVEGRDLVNGWGGATVEVDLSEP